MCRARCFRLVCDPFSGNECWDIYKFDTNERVGVFLARRSVQHLVSIGFWKCSDRVVFFVLLSNRSNVFWIQTETFYIILNVISLWFYRYCNFQSNNSIIFCPANRRQGISVTFVRLFCLSLQSFLVSML